MTVLPAMEVETSDTSGTQVGADQVLDLYTTCKNQIEKLWIQQCNGVGQLNQELAHARECNAILLAALNNLSAEHAKLTENSVLAATREEQLVKQLDEVTIEKDIEELILAQYRDQISEYRAIIDSKQDAIAFMETSLEQANAELAESARESAYYRQTIVVGEDSLAQIRRDLDAKTAELTSLRFQNGCLMKERREALRGYLLLKSPRVIVDTELDDPKTRRNGNPKSRRRGRRRCKRTKATTM